MFKSFDFSPLKQKSGKSAGKFAGFLRILVLTKRLKPKDLNIQRLI
jgi:hypothetical protein